MQKFLLNIILFLLFNIGVVFLIFFLPATPKSSQSLLFISKNKLELLKQTPGPRMVFIGGSNLSFGLSSQLIKDSLGLNPINMGIHASLGLNFMMSQYLNHANKGDIVVLIPEYQQYLDNLAEGTDGEELARMVFDVDLRNFFILNSKQRIQIFSTLPKILKSRFSLNEYLGYEFDFIYSKYVYNEFGDVNTKYLSHKKDFNPDESFNNSTVNHNLINGIIFFKDFLKKQEIPLFISFPGYQEVSFNHSQKKIIQIHSILKKNKFDIVGTPEMFRMHDTFMLNSPYHLNKLGVKHRTNLLINCIQTKYKNNMLTLYSRNCDGK